MNDRVLEDPRTALSTSSIWFDVPEDVFRQHLVRLEDCTNAVPIDPIVSAVPHSSSEEDGRLLPLPVEQNLTDDLAAIAAVEEGAQSVSAVCIEEHVHPSGLTICFAAVDTIIEQVQSFLQEVVNILSTASQSPIDTAASSAENIFVLVVKCHHRRILGRLRSIRWEKPAHLARSHKQPLWRDFANAIHRAQFLYTRKERLLKHEVESQLQELATVYRTFETLEVQHDLEISQLCRLVKLSYRFCTSQTAHDYAVRLSSLPNTTKQIGSALKCLQQVEKIAAYWRIPQTLIQTAVQYSSLFEAINIRYLTPYASVPTSIAYESWAKTCHIHAEIQLAAYYDLKFSEISTCEQNQRQQQPQISPRTLPPRAIGTSKHLCYLCHLFLTHHNHYHVSHTHGRLYDQWTIPDLSGYSDTIRNQYRDIISSMNREVIQLTERVKREIEEEDRKRSEKKPPPKKEGENEKGGMSEQQQQQRKSERKLWKVEPMTSRENLLLLDSSSSSSTSLLHDGQEEE